VYSMDGLGFQRFLIMFIDRCYEGHVVEALSCRLDVPAL
jgi:hypothetical protein